MFEIGDLIEDEWGDLGIIVRQIGVIDRWLVHYLTGDSKLRGHWGDRLHHVEPPEVDKKSEKK
jgi:hypothetical protein